MREAARLVLAGLILGSTGAYGVARLMRSELQGVALTDPTPYLFAFLTLLAVTGLACWLPARRAARVDPIICLRSE
jgi:putative ABC transport system permease protein